MTRQRMGDQKRRKVEAEVGYPIYSMMHRGGRDPRYWQVNFYSESMDPEDGGLTGRYYPEVKRKMVGGIKLTTPSKLVTSDIRWSTR
jgi:hypothetical protein